jgi:hypothetical protein
VLAIQAQAIEEFGGLHGVRDVGALEAALTAAENRILLANPLFGSYSPNYRF